MIPKLGSFRISRRLINLSQSKQDKKTKGKNANIKNKISDMAIDYKSIKRVLVFYSCHNKLLQMQWLEIAPPYYITVFIGQKYDELGWVSSQSFKTKVRCWQGCIPFWRLQDKNCFPAYLGCIHNSIQTEVPTSSLADTQELFSASRGHPHSLAHDPFPLSSKPAMVGQVKSLSQFKSLLFLLLLHLSN